MKAIVGLVVSTMLVTLIMLAGFSTALDSTINMEFCVSCHSMQFPYEEYKKTVHYKNASGVRASCSDCHVPKDLGPKLWAKFIAAKDVYHEVLGTIDNKEKFENERWRMAHNVWEKMRSTNSRECRSCHDFNAMNLELQDSIARKKHEDAETKGKTCIDCHKGIAHEEPEEPQSLQTSSGDKVDD